MSTFKQYEAAIRRGESEALAAWWKAGVDMLAAIAKGKYESVRQFAEAWAKESDDWQFNSINSNMGYIKWAIETGYKCDEFKSFKHLKATRNPNVKSKAAPKVMTKAIDDAKSSFKSMSAKQQREFLAWASANIK